MPWYPSARGLVNVWWALGPPPILLLPHVCVGLIRGPWRVPEARKTAEEYSSGTGWFSGGNLPFNTPGNWKQKSIAALNASVSRRTWNQYKVPLKHMETANSTLGLQLTLPFDEADTVEPKTVRTYLSGLRQAHIVQGLSPPQLVTPTVDLLLKGQGGNPKELSTLGRG